MTCLKIETSPSETSEHPSVRIAFGSRLHRHQKRRATQGRLNVTSTSDVAIILGQDMINETNSEGIFSLGALKRNRGDRETPKRRFSQKTADFAETEDFRRKPQETVDWALSP